MINYSHRTKVESKFVTTGLSGDGITTTANGTAIDRNVLDKLPEGPYEEGLLVVEIEGITGNPTGVLIKHRLEESDDGSTWTPVTDTADVESSITADHTAAGIATLAFRPPGLKRYIRASRSTVTLTGGSSPTAKIRTLFIFTGPRQV